VRSPQSWCAAKAARSLRCILALVVTTLTACDRSTPPPPIANASPRIVAFSPAVGIILTDLGREQQVVGRHGYDDFLPRDIPTCGDQAGIDYERLLGMNPTHVITQWGKRDYPAKLRRLADERSWVLLDTPLTTLADIEDGVRQIDETFGPPTGGSPEYRALRERMAAAWSPVPGAEKMGRVLLLASATPPAAFGPGSCHQDILVRLGGIPAITSGAAYVQMDAEDVLKCAPDAIVLILPRAPDKPTATGDATAALGGLANLDIPAIKNGRLKLIDDPAGQIPSTSMVRFGEELGTWLGRPGRTDGKD